MAWRALAVLGMLVGAVSSAAAARSPTSHLRPQSPRIEKWLDAAQQSSPTVQTLVERIERSDVIVYLDIRHDLRPNVAAGLTWMAATESARVVRASLRPDLRLADAVSMIAHELQHVVELIEQPEVRSNEAMVRFYQRIGRRSAGNGRQWDTDAAVAAGTIARREVIRKVPAALSRVAEPADPGLG